MRATRFRQFQYSLCSGSSRGAGSCASKASGAGPRYAKPGGEKPHALERVSVADLLKVRIGPDSIIGRERRPTEEPSCCGGTGRTGTEGEIDVVVTTRG